MINKVELRRFLFWGTVGGGVLRSVLLAVQDIVDAVIDNTTEVTFL